MDKAQIEHQALTIGGAEDRAPVALAHEAIHERVAIDSGQVRARAAP